MGFTDVSDIASKEFDKIIQSVFDKRHQKRFESLNQIEYLLKDNFEITPGDY